MAEHLLRRCSSQNAKKKVSAALEEDTLARVAEILKEIKTEGRPALERWARNLGDWDGESSLILGPVELARVFESLDESEKALLVRTKERIENFARCQMSSIRPFAMDIPGGRAGQDIVPLEIAGCYVPGGRFPLPSTMLMTAVTARTAGVECVYAASPKPTLLTLGASHVAGVDAVIAVGGAQAIGAFTWGVEGVLQPCDIIVGPGNRYVTAAKKLVAGEVAIDMLAGPSELLVIADASASPALVAADLLAQAEHDTDAIPLLVALDEELADAVEVELNKQLADLPTSEVARGALKNGWCAVVSSLEEAASVANAAVPEHLEVQVGEPKLMVPLLKHYGAIFIGAGAAEVFGDYGAGPNHVLPTGRVGRFSGGLSVHNFLRIRTWMRSDGCLSEEVIDDTMMLAEREGLMGHRHAAKLRKV